MRTLLAKHRSLIVFTLFAAVLSIVFRVIWNGYTHNTELNLGVIAAMALVVTLIADQFERAISRRIARGNRRKGAHR